MKFAKNGKYVYDCNEKSWKDTGLCKDMRRNNPTCTEDTSNEITKYFIGKGVYKKGRWNYNPYVIVKLHIYWDDGTKTQQFDYDTHKCEENQEVQWSEGVRKAPKCTDPDDFRRRLLSDDRVKGDAGAVQLRNKRRHLLFHRRAGC